MKGARTQNSKTKKATDYYWSKTEASKQARPHEIWAWIFRELIDLRASCILKNSQRMGMFQMTRKEKRKNNFKRLKRISQGIRDQSELASRKIL